MQHGFDRQRWRVITVISFFLPVALLARVTSDTVCLKIACFDILSKYAPTFIVYEAFATVAFYWQSKLKQDYANAHLIVCVYIRVIRVCRNEFNLTYFSQLELFN